MPPSTIITFNVDAGTLIIGIVVFFLALLAIVWRGKSEIGEAIKSALAPFGSIAHAITEIQTILRREFPGLIINHSMTEKPGSPLRPTQYGVQLIRDSGLEIILRTGGLWLRDDFLNQPRGIAPENPQ